MEVGARARRLVGLAFLCAVLAGSIAAGGCRTGARRGEILYADGLEQLALGDSAGALARLQQAGYEIPDDPRVLFHMGRLCAAKGGFEARAQAERLLRRAVTLAPQVGVYRDALGELLHRQGFHRESLGQLRQAVRLDPGLGNAWFWLGIEMQRQFLDEPSSRALCDSTRLCFEHALEADAGKEEARYRLAFLHMVQGELERARQLVEPMVYGRSCPGRFGLLLAAIEFRARRFETAQSNLDATLACLQGAPREAVLGLRCLLHPDSLPVYVQSPDRERDSLRTAFWWRRDPTPATHVNERLLEHVARLVDADFYFEVPSLAKPGSETERGEIYLRYGRPLVAERSAEYDYPAWCWTYRDSPARGPSFVFLDRTLNGNYLRLKRGTRSDYSNLELVEALPETTALRFATPASGWRYALRVLRGDSGRAAIELAYEIEVDSLFKRLALESAAWRGPDRLAARCRAEARRESFYQLDGGRAVGRLRFEVPCERLEIGLQATAMRAPADSARASPRLTWMVSGRQDLEVPRWDPDRLSMSDVLLAYDVHEGSGGPFDMGGVVVVPRVDTRVSTGRLPLFFEVYPPAEVLQDRRALAVAYRVQQMPPSRWRFRDQFRRDTWRSKGRVAVEATFRIAPQAPVERQHLEIDLRHLGPGDYELRVEVRDPITGEAALRKVTFTIPDAAEVSRPANSAGDDSENR